MIHFHSTDLLLCDITVTWNINPLEVTLSYSGKTVSTTCNTNDVGTELQNLANHALQNLKTTFRPGNTMTAIEKRCFYTRKNLLRQLNQ